MKDIWYGGESLQTTGLCKTCCFSMEISQENQGENPDDGEELSSVFTCEICIEPVMDRAKFKKQSSCTHPFCEDCISKYIQVKVEEYTSDGGGSINCPGLDCPNLLDPLACRSLISPALFSKWSDRLCESLVLGFDGTTSCYCPNRVCSELIVNECGETVTKTNCPKCKRVFCFHCKSVWHESFRCGENRDANDILFGNLIARQKWQRCPNCGRCIDRFAGCSRVTCRCQTSFCYGCGQIRCQCTPAERIRGCCRQLLTVFIYSTVPILFLLYVWRSDD